MDRYERIINLHRVLQASRRPVTVARLQDELGCSRATVYRALRWLEERGFAESFALHCEEHGTERYYVRSAETHRHWFHCESCHRFIDLGACRIEGLSAQLEKDLGVRINRHILYFVGCCPSCAACADGSPSA